MTEAAQASPDGFECSSYTWQVSLLSFMPSPRLNVKGCSKSQASRRRPSSRI